MRYDGSRGISLPRYRPCAPRVPLPQTNHSYGRANQAALDTAWWGLRSIERGCPLQDLFAEASGLAVADATSVGCHPTKARPFQIHSAPHRFSVGAA